MKKQLHSLLPLLLTILTFTGCRDFNPWDPGDPNNPGNSVPGVTIPELFDVEWKLVAFEEWSNGAVTSSTPAPEMFPYTLTFTENGLHGRNECSSYTGEYSLGKKNALSIFNVHEPEVACGPRSGTTTYLDALAKGESYQASMTTLRIFYEGGTKALRFSRSLSQIRLVQYELIFLPPGDPFQTDEVRINTDVLTFDVTYGGGCADHTFDLYGPKVTSSLNDPNWARLTIIHNANGDMCEALISQRLDFDLTPLKEQWRQLTGKTSGEIELQITSYGVGGPDRRITYRF